jgi:eukaryotic-like serine/threonine-protein kinase
MELFAGRTISHYRILDKLGEGGMGVVYRAEDIRLGRHVALKLLPRSVSAGAEERRRLLNEARAAAAISHPNVAHIYEISDETEEPFIAMELIEGTVLRERIGSLTIEESVRIAIGIAEGLAEAHRNGIIHRDIKPENIMLRASGVPVVMDFGVARLEAAAHLTLTGTTRGTAAYMAPEQIQEGEVDARSDIFSLGVMLYEMIAGVRPFKGLH